MGENIQKGRQTCNLQGAPRILPSTWPLRSISSLTAYLQEFRTPTSTLYGPAYSIENQTTEDFENLKRTATAHIENNLLRVN